METRLGILLWSQATDWAGFERSAIKIDELGYEHLWTWDHLLPIFGELDQPVHEGYTALAALAQATERIRPDAVQPMSGRLFGQMLAVSVVFVVVLNLFIRVVT